MIEHGIFTSKADYWVHLFPLKARMFWYRCEHCRNFIRLNKIKQTDGKSKNGDVTGRGFLIPQDACFVFNAQVPNDLLRGIDWKSLTDRDASKHGEFIFGILIERNCIRFPVLRGVYQEDKQTQLSGIDFICSYSAALSIDVKTERVNSDNLFVQSHEEGHKVNLIVDGDGVREEISPAVWDAMWDQPFDRPELL